MKLEYDLNCFPVFSGFSTMSASHFATKVEILYTGDVNSHLSEDIWTESKVFVNSLMQALVVFVLY